MDCRDPGRANVQGPWQPQEQELWHLQTFLASGSWRSKRLSGWSFSVVQHVRHLSASPDWGPFSIGVQFSSVQSLSHVQLSETPWTAACQASLSITNSQSLLKLMSIDSVMPSNHLILCCPLFLLTHSSSIPTHLSSTELLTHRKKTTEKAEICVYLTGHEHRITSWNG